MKNKRELRGNIRSICKTISTKDKLAFSIKIIEKLTELEEFKSARCVGFFYDKFEWEPLLYTIMKEHNFFEKRVALPKCKDFEFDYIADFTKLKKGTKNTCEPADGVFLSPEEIDLIIVPGMSFGMEDGERLGLGGGFYDRYLAKYNGTTIGIAFEQLLMNEIPVFEWDETVDILITQESVRRFT